MRILVAPHAVSRGAKALAEELGAKRIRHDRETYRPRSSDVVINWGRGRSMYYAEHVWILNRPEHVSRAGNKLLALRYMSAANVPVPEFTDDQEVAQAWVDSGGVAVVRHTLRGHGGEGIEVCDSGSVPQAPLYTKYVKKKDEYRVHVVGGEVVDVQQKRRRRGGGAEDATNRKVRNYCNGWVFCRDGVAAPAAVLSAAKAAVSALRLDFGGVDVGYNHYFKTACVYEVNTACGYEGSTAANMARALRDHAQWTHDYCTRAGYDRDSGEFAAGNVQGRGADTSYGEGDSPAEACPPAASQQSDAAPAQAAAEAARLLDGTERRVVRTTLPEYFQQFDRRNTVWTVTV